MLKPDCYVAYVTVPGTWIARDAGHDVIEMQRSIGSVLTLLDRVGVGIAGYQEATAARLERARMPRGTRCFWRPPSPYVADLCSVFAEAVVHALFHLREAVQLLANTSGIATIDAALVTFDDAIPALRPIRNSVAHRDERLRGRARGKPIIGKSIDRPGMFVEAKSVIVIGSFYGDRFMMTTADGSQAEVDITPITGEVAASLVQATLNAFPWTGSPSQHPQPRDS